MKLAFTDLERIVRTPREERRAFARTVGTAVHRRARFNPYTAVDPDQPTGSPVVYIVGGLVLLVAVAISVANGWAPVGAAAAGLFQ